jgi:uncharacterized protein (DUF302 family)
MTSPAPLTGTKTRTIPVEHVTVVSSLPFTEVRQRLETVLPTLDPKIVNQLAAGDAAGATAYDRSGPKLSIFLIRDHGVLLQIAGRPRQAVQYEIGNPLTASKMTRNRLSAALYAPLRVVLFEDEDGRSVFEYDKPSSLFGQFGDDRVTEVGRSLDAELEAAVRLAAAA